MWQLFFQDTIFSVQPLKRQPDEPDKNPGYFGEELGTLEPEYSQMVLSFERFRAHSANVLPLVAVRQLVLSQGGCIPKHFAADL